MLGHGTVLDSQMKTVLDRHIKLLVVRVLGVTCAVRSIPAGRHITAIGIV